MNIRLLRNALILDLIINSYLSSVGCRLNFLKMLKDASRLKGKILQYYSLTLLLKSLSLMSLFHAAFFHIPYSSRQKALRVSRENEIKKILPSATPPSSSSSSSSTLSATQNMCGVEVRGSDTAGARTPNCHIRTHIHKE